VVRPFGTAAAANYNHAVPKTTAAGAMRATRLLLALLAAHLAGCKQDSTDAGTQPSGTPAPPVTATATPTPAATPVPTPSVKSCVLPNMPDCSKSGCCAQGPPLGFESEIRAAQLDFPIRFPDMIRPDNTIRDTSFYTQQIAQYLVQTYGYCAVPGPGFGEIRVKKSNELAQHVKVVSSFDTSFIGSVFTCIPASF